MSLEAATKGAAYAADSPEFPMPPLPADWLSLGGAFVSRAKTHPAKEAVCDSTGASLTYGETFLRAAALARVLSRTLGPEPYVGLLLPPTVPSVVANLALVLLGVVPVNLNYTASQDLVDSSIDQCGIKYVLTSPKVLDRFKIVPKGTLIHLEDLPKQVRWTDKAWAAAVAKVFPMVMLRRVLPGLRGDQLDRTATVIFTSGSTGDPKGVVLSHRNVLSNILQIDAHLKLLPDEVVLGILPFFHSFGFTVALWTVLCLGKKVAYHFNPLEARVVGNLCEKHGVTMILGSPTYMRTYLQRCPAGQFSKLVHLVLGAEKLKPELARDIKQTLGVESLEGYGCTELSPVVSVNVLHEKTLRDGRTVAGNRPGTVGLPLPGTLVKSVDPETGADLPRGTEGMLVVSGPQVMVGYLNRPEATAKVLKDGWYTTGDLGYVDPDGFIKITDRVSRFSKVAGEMVPHQAVETAIMEAAGVNEQSVAVTSLPDAKRGERLIAIYTDLGMPVEEVCRRLSAGSLPKLWLPSANDFIAVEAIPILGSGKVDLRGLRELARERVTV
jgi:acyl-[acyl-carrier-protein]-phospholipid O-acyltransferase / long-chain-fatty-acid--[acyl-carrier-protein] ligase